MKFEKRLVSIAAAALAVTGADAKSSFLQILHSSDHESAFQDPNTLEEKVVHYSALVRGLELLAEREGMQSIHLTAGDHINTGPFFNAAAEATEFMRPGLGDISIFNAIVNRANCFGNHELSSGIDNAAHIINSANYPFLSANLDFSNVILEDPSSPPIQIGADATPCSDVVGQVAKSCILRTSAVTIGLIGRAPEEFFGAIAEPEKLLPGLDFVGGQNPTTRLPLEPSITKVLEQVDLLKAQGASLIILLDHEQEYTNTENSAKELRGIDIVISGGTSRFLAGERTGPFNYIREGDQVEGEYPLRRKDMNDNDVFVLTVNGFFRYIGMLIIEIDEQGNVIGVDPRSGVIATTAEATARLGAELGFGNLDPIPRVRETLDILQATPLIQQGFNVIGSTTGILNGFRADIRGRETNLGRLTADSTLWGGNRYAASNNLPRIDIALKNGGGIRASIEGPTIIRLVIEAALAFDNKLGIVEVTGAQLIATMENSVSRVQGVDGRFPHFAGMFMEYDLGSAGLEGLESLDIPSRIKTLVVTRSTGVQDALITDFQAQGDLSRTFIMATNTFLMAGGDGYAALAAGKMLGETEIGEQQILQDYISSQLNGVVNIEEPPSPPRLVQGCRSLAEIAAAGRSNFGVFMELMQIAGIGYVITSSTPITIFAPTDQAFEELPDGTLDALKRNPSALGANLTYHFAGGDILFTDLADGDNVTMLDQEMAFVSLAGDGTYMLNDAAVIGPDNIACSGVFHIIDKVLVPVMIELTTAPTEAPVLPSSSGLILGFSNILCLAMLLTAAL